jgi:hypothetical protein
MIFLPVLGEIMRAGFCSALKLMIQILRNLGFRYINAKTAKTIGDDKT